MSSETPNPEEGEPVDLNKLRGDVLAGRVKRKQVDFSRMTEKQQREWPPHIIQPELHPEIDFSNDPDINKLRRIALERRAREQGKTLEEVAREEGIETDDLPVIDKL